MESFYNFIEENYVKSPRSRTAFSVMFNEYQSWLLNNKPNEKALGKHSFYNLLKDLPYRKINVGNLNYIKGLESVAGKKFPERKDIQQQKILIAPNIEGNNDIEYKKDKYEDFLVIDHSEHNQPFPNYERFQFENRDEYENFIISEYEKLRT